MVNTLLSFVPGWHALRAFGGFARRAAVPVTAAHPPAHLMTCGRGGTGRRAALRSLWPQGRGSSSLLDRTITRSQHAGGMLDRVIKWEADMPGACRTLCSAQCPAVG